MAKNEQARGSMVDSIPSTRAAAVAAELRRMILVGELPVGEKLRQVEISKRFGVSTTPVREAFTVLAREGLVDQDAHRGVRVVLPSHHDLQENYEIRLLLEPLATNHAAEHITEQQLEELKVQLSRMEATNEDESPNAEESERVAADREFHRIIYAASERPRLAEMIEQLRNSADLFISIGTSKRPPPEYRQLVNRQHMGVFEALRRGDGDEAAEEMKRHLQANFEQISKALADVGATSAAP